MIALARRRSLLKYLCVGLLILNGVPSQASTEETTQELPLVKAGALPLYPLIARAARVDGVVRVRVATDGKKVILFEAESGPAMLVKAAKENIKTWEFDEHTPTKFVTTFVYRIEEPSQCYFSNGTATLHIPLEVRITVNGLKTCDPASTITTIFTPKRKQ